MSDNSKIKFKNNISDNNSLAILSKSELKKNIILNKIILKNNMEIQKKNKKNKKNKMREPGIDLVRILGMYAIIIFHFIYFGHLTKKYYKYHEIDLIYILTFWHVSSFALISGIVGYKSNKYSNLLYLWLQVLFYSFGIYLVIKEFKPIWINHEKEKLYEYIFPVVFQKYWYFTQYFGMYLLLPAVNKGLAILEKTEFKLLVLSSLGIYIIWKDFWHPKIDTFRMSSGYSVIWLLIFYIAGAFIGRYNTKKYSGVNKIIFCLLCICSYLSSSLSCYILLIYDVDEKANYFKKILIKTLKQLFIPRISSMPMIIQAFSVVLFFNQIKYHINIARIISSFGPLTFGIYLIHNHNLIKRNIIGNLFGKESNSLSLNTIIILFLIRGLIVFAICIIIDYIRNLIFTFCKIKNVCIYIEKQVFKLFK